MSLLQCLDLHYSAGTKPIFEGLSFTVAAGEKVVSLLTTDAAESSSLIVFRKALS